LLVEDDVSGPGPSAGAAGPDGASLYAAGDLDASGLASKPQMYIIKKVGMFPDISEALAMGHLSRGDTVRVEGGHGEGFECGLRVRVLDIGTECGLPCQE